MKTWAFAASIALSSVQACSGKVLTELGNVSHAGSTGSPHFAGAPSGDAGADPRAGNSASGGLDIGSSGAAGGASVAGAFDDAGAGGNHEPDPVQAGGGNVSDPVPLQCPTCQLLVERSDIRGIATTPNKVYWVEYGTTDALGNYAGDGRLLARDLSGGPSEVLASALPGPDSVAVSDAYAYLFVDGLTATPGVPNGIVRVPLSGGAGQVVASFPSPSTTVGYTTFAEGDGYQYFTWDGALYRVAETAAPIVESVVTSGLIYRVFSDNSSLYFWAEDGVWATPFSSSQYAKIGSATLRDVMLVSGDYLYAQEYPDPHGSDKSFYLTRLPKVGGVWQRIAKISDEFFSSSHLAIDADQYFIDQEVKGERLLVQTSLSDASKRTVLARQSPGRSGLRWPAWSHSPVGIFLATSTGLYQMTWTTNG